MSDLHALESRVQQISRSLALVRREVIKLKESAGTVEIPHGPNADDQDWNREPPENLVSDATIEKVSAKHNETGRLWFGRRCDIPAGYTEVVLSNNTVWIDAIVRAVECDGNAPRHVGLVLGNLNLHGVIPAAVVRDAPVSAALSEGVRKLREKVIFGNAIENLDIDDVLCDLDRLFELSQRSG